MSHVTGVQELVERAVRKENAEFKDFSLRLISYVRAKLDQAREVRLA